MSDVHDLIALGDLDGAIGLAAASLKARPSDAAMRLLMADLLCIQGDWDRALRHLDVLEKAGGPATATAATSRVLIAAERTRGGPAPAWVWMGRESPPAWADDQRAGLDALIGGRPDAARAHLDRVDAARPPVAGTIGGAPFVGLRDLDDTFGPRLEVFTPDGPEQAAWEDVRYLDVAPPKVLRDLIWAPARLALADGAIGRVYLPALYPGTARDAPAPLRLGRVTDWSDLGGGLCAGLGLKMILVGDEARSLFELHELIVPRDATDADAPAPETA